MDITPTLPKGRHLITGYGEGGFKINHERVDGSILLLGNGVRAWDGNLQDNDFSTGIELLLIGTGARITPIDASLRAALRKKNIAVEVMDTGAACRTYNVLLTEGRRVVAALMAV